jgi:hypothetical protein
MAKAWEHGNGFRVEDVSVMGKAWEHRKEGRGSPFVDMDHY